MGSGRKAPTLEVRGSVLPTASGIYGESSPGGTAGQRVGGPTMEVKGGWCWVEN